MNQTKTVGVVIPIYNVEKYLKECLDSVINQTYKNLQIILVNDGSTDEHSLNIAKEYTLKDERFILFDKENGGLSSARNVGIEYFSGEYKLKNKTQTIKENSLLEFELDGNNSYNIYKVYKSYKAFNNEKDLNNFTYPIIDYIIFLDSDDYWELNCIEECVPRMDGVEVVWFDWKYYCEIDFNENLTYHDRYNFQQGIISSLQWLKRYPYTDITWFSFAWNGMISFDFLKIKKLFFINEIIHEDVFFGIALFLSCNYIYFLNMKLYYYRIRHNSLCNYDRTNNLSWMPTYLYNIHKEFKDIGDTKYYHRLTSNIITYINLIRFIKKENILIQSDDLNILLEHRKIGLWDILDCYKDPLRILSKIPNEICIEKIFSLKYENSTLQKNNNDFKIMLSHKDKDLQNTNSNFNQAKYLLSFQTKYGTAKSRIQNQLSYKLGQTLIINSKSIFGILCMPIYIISTILTYNQEQKIYQEKIKKDPSLKLPLLESYPDYQEALKEKECLTYKLGQALIKANKTWYGWGYIKLLFEIRKLKKEFKNKMI